MASISEREKREIEAANAAGNTRSSLFGLWLLPSSELGGLLQAGRLRAPDARRPDDPETVEGAGEPGRPRQEDAEAGCRPHGRGDRQAREEAAVMGHSTGACWRRCSRVETYGGHRGDRSASSAAFCLAGFRAQGRGPVPGQPRYRGRAITLTLDQFSYGWANALDEEEAKRLYDTYHVAGSGIALAQMADANLNLDRVEGRHEEPRSGPAADPRRGEGPRFPGRSPTPPTSGRRGTRASPRSRRCPTAALADHRPRVAGGRSDRARFRQAVRPGQADPDRLRGGADVPGRCSSGCCGRRSVEVVRSGGCHVMRPMMRRNARPRAIQRADRIDQVEVGKHQDVEEPGAGGGPRASRRSRSRIS